MLRPSTPAPAIYETLKHWSVSSNQPRDIEDDMSKRLRGAVAGCLFVLLSIGFLVFRSSTSQAQNPKKKPQNNGQFVPGRVLVQFRPETLSLPSVDVIAEAGATDTGEIAGTGVHIVELPAGTDEAAYVRAFQSRPEVEFAELDRIIPPADLIPNDPWYANWEWHLQKIQAPTAWSMNAGSANIVIAILDTGVDGTHEDLASKMVLGWNIYDNNSDTRDVNGHGTLVAGTAAASSNNGIGVASVAWGCSVMPVRISDPTGYAYFSNMASGLTWAADHGARVANLSYGATDSSTVASAAQYFQSKGGVVTLAAGNQGTFDPSPDNPYVLTVSGTDPNDLLYAWSNTGNNIDVAAPGSAFTTVNGGGYTAASGTSIAAPIVAGVAALLLSASPNLTGDQVQTILKQSADDLGPVGWDTSYGYGRVNAARALSMVSGGTVITTPPTVSFVSPASGATLSGASSIQVTASDNAGVSSVGLSLDGAAIGTDTAAPYNFAWNTSGAANGLHALTATAQDAAGNTATASISVTVSNSSDTAPPAITIVSPANGARVSTSVSVVVNTTDNVGVVRVELYVDGALTGSSTTAPFTTKWNTRKAKAGAHPLQCKASDAAGNVGISSTCLVYK
jgi:thermitase